MPIERTPVARTEGRTTGRMTAAMRAVAVPSGPRVLRLGVVRAGRLVDERIVKSLADVTVGRDESCTFVAACERHGLFVRSAGGYAIVVGAGMTAKVALERGVRDLDAGERAALDEDARGRVRLPGGDTLLFQLVVAPVAAQKPVLPLAVRSGEGIDWNLTMIAALSFLFHFGFVGALYSDWADTQVQDAPTVAGLVDLAKLAPANVPLETHEPEVPKTAEAPKDAVGPSDTGKKQASQPGARPSRGASSAPSSGQAGKEAAMVANAERMAMDVLGTLGQSGTASDRALRRGSDIPPVDMSAEAQKDTSVGPSAALATRSTGPLGPGKASDLSTLGDTHAAPGHDKAGPARETGGPVLETRVDPARATVPVSHADRVVATLRPRFRRCYEQGLATDPGMAGRATLTAKINANGEVASVDVSVTGLSSAVGSCLARTLKSAEFDPPGGTGSTLSVPVTLVQNK